MNEAQKRETLSGRARRERVSRYDDLSDSAAEAPNRPRKEGAGEKQAVLASSLLRLIERNRHDLFCLIDAQGGVKRRRKADSADTDE